MDKPLSAYQGEDPYVFVCYAHDDADVVYHEMTWLRDQGVNLWYDEGISAGKNDPVVPQRAISEPLSYIVSIGFPWVFPG